MSEPETASGTARGVDSGYPRLEDQILWYSRKGRAAQNRFRLLKVIQIIVAAAIPVVSLIRPDSALIPGALGALLLILEGFQELGGYRQTWQTYRSAGERLKAEKFLYMAGAGAYTDLDPETARRSLAERVEEVIGTEHAGWVRRFSQRKSGPQEG